MDRDYEWYLDTRRCILEHQIERAKYLERNLEKIPEWEKEVEDIKRQQKDL